MLWRGQKHFAPTFFFSAVSAAHRGREHGLSAVPGSAVRVSMTICDVYLSAGLNVGSIQCMHTIALGILRFVANLS